MLEPSVELLKLLLDGGFSAVIIYMLMDMRKEQRETNARIWTLLEYIVRRDENEPLG